MRKNKLITEPYSISPGDVRGSACLHADDGCYYMMDAPRARRIAACVNACLGIPTRKLAKQRKNKTSFIVELSDDYGSKYYGPFSDKEAVESWVKESLKDQAGIIEDGYVYISPERRLIGRAIELKTTYEPGIIRDGH